ncbi:hypothetical protein [Pseudomonas sp. BMS12]|uniref:hypothetical protein n=1 Tax=Pseudomonas sp. BMS12 TaxID=1796033 RepID=UPI000839F893|nr:hypothetical protein [Pseudomonas sp. BMS12]
MNNLHCTYRDHAISAAIIEHPGIPTPWAAGCKITLPDGHATRRIPLPVKNAFLADLDSAQRASLAHGKWLVDQHLDRGLALH